MTALEARSAERLELEIEISTVERDRDYHHRRAAAAEQHAHLLEHQRGFSRGLRRLPTSLQEVVHARGAIWPDRIVFTDRARASAEKASLNKLPTEIPQAWYCVWMITTDLYEMIFNGICGQGNPAKEFQARTGLEISFTEENKRSGIESSCNSGATYSRVARSISRRTSSGEALHLGAFASIFALSVIRSRSSLGIAVITSIPMAPSGYPR
jgi:hypothetical protein